MLSYSMQAIFLNVAYLLRVYVFLFKSFGKSLRITEYYYTYEHLHNTILKRH